MSWLAKIYPDAPCPILQMYGSSKVKLDFIFMLATTKPMETVDKWWQVRMMALYETGNWRN